MVNPRISIVVTVYDAEAYINNSIDSIISCSSIELELILVNDGSPDDCGKICEEYA